MINEYDLDAFGYGYWSATEVKPIPMTVSQMVKRVLPRLVNFLSPISMLH
jgi:hypothetical protein